MKDPRREKPFRNDAGQCRYVILDSIRHWNISALPDNSEGGQDYVGMDERTLRLVPLAVMAIATFVIAACAYLLLRNRL